jgi:hypothetical protein
VLAVGLFGGNELITMSYTPPSNIPLASIARVEFVHKMRSTSDDVVLELAENFKDLRVELPCLEVFE